MSNTTISDTAPSIAYGNHSSGRVVDPPLGYIGQHRAAQSERKPVAR